MGTSTPALIRPADLRLRLLAAVLALFLFTPVKTLGPALGGLGGVLLLYLFWRQRIPWKRLFHLEAFLLLLLLTLPFTLPGSVLFQLGPLVASVEGLVRAFIIACKVTASVLLISVLFASSDPLILAGALRGLRVPESLVRLFIAVIRYLSLIQPEFARLREAMRARAFTPRSSRHTWRSYGYLLGMVLVRSFERSERIEEAMALRGYSGRFLRTEQPLPSASDWVVASGIVFAAILIFIWDRVWQG